MLNSFGARSTLRVEDKHFEIFRLEALSRQGYPVERLPCSLRVLLECLLRTEDGTIVRGEDIEALARWRPGERVAREIAYTPARVLLQDFTGVPALVDLAAMRDAVAELGGDPVQINPLQPVELVIDHSIQVDSYGTPEAFSRNADLEFMRNRERYAFLRWGQKAFARMGIVPPNSGIVHQVNLEFLARVVFTRDEGGANGAPQAYPDSLVGTDSHTPMVNGLGVLGWGVGGIEAEAAMLGQPVSLLLPEVVGFRLTGALREGATATDLVLTITQKLRAHGVVGKFVEFYGPGLSRLPVADRATIANMSPEYGATCAFFPVDEETLRYLRLTGRSAERLALVERYVKEQGLFRTDETPEPIFSETLSLDLGEVEPSVSGPRRPQDRVPLREVGRSFIETLPELSPDKPSRSQKGAAAVESDGRPVGVWGESGTHSPREVLLPEPLKDGSVVIAAITSCTNTSNPAVMLAAGILAKKAVARGLRTRPWVKTSLAPGSKVVTRYLERAGLTPALEALGFHLVGYGCTTCIGNSGPLPPEISEEIARNQLVVCSVLSGNRNFEGRIHSEVRANYLMSPPLVVAYALAGHIEVDLTTEPLGTDAQGQPVFLRDIFPTQEEIQEAIREAVRPEMFHETYRTIFSGDARWHGLSVPEGELFAWEPDSTYIRRPAYLEGLTREPPEKLPEIRGARVLAWLGDSTTTDHISPAGSIRKDSPAGRYLIERGVSPEDFNSYGARRGNHEVMVRGTFANVRLRNRLAPGTEGGYTTYLPSGEVMSIYDAAMRYQQDKTPLLILAGKEYGSGSSRDWAAKGPYLLGVRAVLAESFERIHRSNLVGMGILPLQFQPGESATSLGLQGDERFSIEGLEEALAMEGATGQVKIRAEGTDGKAREFSALVRIDTPQEALYYRHGGILTYVLRRLLSGREQPEVLSRGVAAAPLTEPETSSLNSRVDEGSIESFPASDPPGY